MICRFTAILVGIIWNTVSGVLELYTYSVTIDPAKQYDGDSGHMSVDLGFNVWMHADFRLDGIDTPEIKGKTKREKQLAIQARDYFISLLKQSAELRCVVNERADEKYGRALIVLYGMQTDGTWMDINQQMVKSGNAHTYDGGTKTAW